MKIIKANPTSPGRRFVINIKHYNLYKGKPLKKLIQKKNEHAGRNNNGRITIRHKSSGHKKHYRIIDFKRLKDNIYGTVEHIEYDPNRTANIALILYQDGERRYIIAPKNLKEGMQIISGKEVKIQIGNCMPMINIPTGTNIHNLELKPGKGAQLIRSAGSYAQIIGKDNYYATIRLRSGEIRKILLTCRAVIGIISNVENNLKSIGKAGANRWRGIRPTVRGVAMNPVDHPHGGGEGKTSSGGHPVSPWGLQTKGKKTRKNKRSDKFIIQRRRISKT